MIRFPMGGEMFVNLININMKPEEYFLELINQMISTPISAIDVGYKEFFEEEFKNNNIEGSHKFIMVYLEYFYLLFHLLKRELLNLTDIEETQRIAFIRIIQPGLAKDVVDKYFTGSETWNEFVMLKKMNESELDYSKCNELIPPGERAFVETAMSTRLGKRIAEILTPQSEEAMIKIIVCAAKGIIAMSSTIKSMPKLITEAIKII